MSAPDDPQVTIAELDQQRKALSREIGQRKARGEPVTDLLERSRRTSAQIAALSGGRPRVRPEARPEGQETTTDVLSTAGAVVALRDEWRELLDRCLPDSLYLTWEWMASWYETYEDEGAIRCLTVRDDGGHLLGVVPLFLSERHDRKLSRRQIGFASTYGHSWGSFLEVISPPEAYGTVAAATAQYLRSIRAEWDCVKFLRVPGEAQSLGPLVSALASQQWQVGVRPYMRCAVMALPEDPGDVVASIASPKLRQHCRAAERRLQADYPRHTWQLCTTEEQVVPQIERCMALNVRRRAWLGRTSAFAQPQRRLCVQRALRRFWQAGWLRLLRLEVDGEPAGFKVYLVYRQRASLLISAWASEYARYELGHLLFAHALSLAAEEGARHADFLIGEEWYKKQYTRATRQLLDIVVWPNRLQLGRALLGEAWHRTVDRGAWLASGRARPADAAD